MAHDCPAASVVEQPLAGMPNSVAFTPAIVAEATWSADGPLLVMVNDVGALVDPVAVSGNDRSCDSLIDRKSAVAW